MRKGFIYVITNKINGKQYVGQTSRDIDTRFHEHCAETRGNSKLHSAIQKYGWQNFKVEQLEEVSLSDLDEREKYWISKLDTKENGYNILIGGQIKANYPQLVVVENGIVFDSKEEAARIISSLTSWNLTFISDKLKECIASKKEFLGYHFEQKVNLPASDLSVQEDWIKTLNIKFQGQHIYCIELDKEFDTIGVAAKFLVDNNYYYGNSYAPIQDLISCLSQGLKNGRAVLTKTNPNLSFEKIPGKTTKNSGSETSFVKKKIYCPQLDMTFNSQVEAAGYLIDNNIWSGIKKKTAKLRISDVVRGVFPHYRNFTFQEVE